MRSARWKVTSPQTYAPWTDAERLVVTALAIVRHPIPLHAVEFMVARFSPGLAVKVPVAALIQSRIVSLDRATQWLALNDIDAEFALRKLPAAQASYAVMDRVQAPEAEAARALTELLQIGAEGTPTTRVRCLLDLVRTCLNSPDLVRASDLVEEASRLAAAEGAAELVGEAGSLRESFQARRLPARFTHHEGPSGETVPDAHSPTDSVMASGPTHS